MMRVCWPPTDHLTAAPTAYQVGQRVFGRHGATLDYFAGAVVAVEPDEVYPYTVDLGDGNVVRVLAREIESDLPEPGLSLDAMVDWLTA